MAAASAKVLFNFSPEIENDPTAVAAARSVVAESPERVVVVASSNPTKIRCVSAAAPHLVAIGVDVESGVPLQPVGRAETLRGAMNRVANAAALVPDAAFWVGIENGMWQLTEPDAIAFDAAFVKAFAASAAPNNSKAVAAGLWSYPTGVQIDTAAALKAAADPAYRHWVDAAAVVIRDRTGALLCGWSGAVPLPPHWVSGSLSTSPAGMYTRHTSERGMMSVPDAHTFLTAGKRGRILILYEAVRALIANRFAELVPPPPLPADSKTSGSAAASSGDTPATGSAAAATSSGATVAAANGSKAVSPNRPISNTKP